MLAGIGMNACIPIKSDLKGRMCVKSLEEAILQTIEAGK